MGKKRDRFIFFLFLEVHGTLNSLFLNLDAAVVHVRLGVVSTVAARQRQVRRMGMRMRVRCCRLRLSSGGSGSSISSKGSGSIESERGLHVLRQGSRRLENQRLHHRSLRGAKGDAKKKKKKNKIKKICIFKKLKIIDRGQVKMESLFGKEFGLFWVVSLRYLLIIIYI